MITPYPDNLIYFAMGFFCAFVVRWMIAQTFLATAPAETQKPETRESRNLTGGAS
jgi:hypothetical protein